jgi:hypothetical protein
MAFCMVFWVTGSPGMTGSPGKYVTLTNLLRSSFLEITWRTALCIDGVTVLFHMHFGRRNDLSQRHKPQHRHDGRMPELPRQASQMRRKFKRVWPVPFFITGLPLCSVSARATRASHRLFLPRYVLFHTYWDYAHGGSASLC